MYHVRRYWPKVYKQITNQIEVSIYVLVCEGCTSGLDGVQAALRILDACRSWRDKRVDFLPRGLNGGDELGNDHRVAGDVARAVALVDGIEAVLAAQASRTRGPGGAFEQDPTGLVDHQNTESP